MSVFDVFTRYGTLIILYKEYKYLIWTLILE